jgi:DNA replication protein DnaC
MLGRLTDPFAVGARCPIVWISWPEYLCRIRDTFSRGHGSDETESDILDELSGASIAIIDDLGAEPRTTTDWAEGTLCRVLERAVSSLSPTLVLTSNLSLAEIGGRYGERVMGRITEAVSGPGGGILAFGNVPNYFDHQGKR